MAVTEKARHDARCSVHLYYVPVMTIRAAGTLHDHLIGRQCARVLFPEHPHLLA